MSPLQFVVVIYLYIGRPILGYEFEGINPETVELRQSELLQYVQIENAKKKHKFHFRSNLCTGSILSNATIQGRDTLAYEEDPRGPCKNDWGTSLMVRENGRWVNKKMMGMKQALDSSFYT